MTLIVVLNTQNLINGYQICEQLRRISCFTKIPIIILTSSDGAFDRVRAKRVFDSEAWR
ncbi:MAG: hypothetical protein WCO29_19760 [Nostocales cyanobacterium ELA583]